MKTYDTLKRDDTFDKFSLNYTEIQEYQQNRYPYLFLDHVEEIELGNMPKASKIIL